MRSDFTFTQRRCVRNAGARIVSTGARMALRGYRAWCRIGGRMQLLMPLRPTLPQPVLKLWRIAMIAVGVRSAPGQLENRNDSTGPGSALPIDRGGPMDAVCKCPKPLPRCEILDHFGAVRL